MPADNAPSNDDRPARWVDVAAASDLPEEESLEMTVEGQLVALFRHGGRLYAIEGLCAHHGGPLAEGVVAEGCVTCPWHGWQYRLEDGTQTTSGAPLIRAYPVRQRDGRIEVDLSAPVGD